MQLEVFTKILTEFTRVRNNPRLQTRMDKVVARYEKKLADLRNDLTRKKAQAVAEAKVTQEVADTVDFLSYMDKVERTTKKTVQEYTDKVTSLKNQIERLKRKSSIEKAFDKRDLRNAKKEIAQIEAQIRQEESRIKKYLERKARDIAVRKWRKTGDGAGASRAIVQWRKNSNIPIELFTEEEISTSVRSAQDVMERRKKQEQKPVKQKIKNAGQKLNTSLFSDVATLEGCSLKQNRPDNIGTKISMYKARSANVDAILRTHLIDPNGNVIDERSFADVILCKDRNGDYDANAQELLDKYRYHQHGIDRMSFVERTQKALHQFIKTHPEYSSTGKSKLSIKEIEHRASQGDEVAMEYVTLAKAYANAKDKPVFGDSEGNPVNASTHKAITRMLAEKHPWLIEKSAEIDAWWDKYMQAWAVGSVISQSQYDMLRTIYPHYTPTHRVIDKKTVKEYGGKKGKINIGGLMKAKGSTLDLNPVADNFARMITQNVEKYRLAEIHKNLYESLLEDDDHKLAEYARLSKSKNETKPLEKMNEDHLADGISESDAFNVTEDWVEWTSLVDGELVTIEISQEMYKNLLSLTHSTVADQSTGYQAWKKAGKWLSAPLKITATAKSLTFPIRNFIKDTQNAIVDDGFAILWYELRAAAQMTGYKLADVSKFIAKFIEGKATNAEANKMLKFFQAVERFLLKNNMWQLFKDLGGKNSSEIKNFSSFADTVTGDSSAEQFRKHNYGASGANMVKKTAGKISSAIGAAGEFTESLVRYAAFMHQMKKGGDTEVNRSVAIKRSAEVTLDFSRHGDSSMQMINAWTPYFNAQLQGLIKPFREMKNRKGADKAHYIKRYITMGVLPTVASAFALINWFSDDDEEEYRELTQRQRDAYYNIPLGNGKFLKLPKDTHQSQLLGNVAERFMLWMTDGDPDSDLSDYFSDYLETSILASFQPSIPIFDTPWIGTIIDIMANKDFAGRAIVPTKYQTRLAHEQYDETTSSFAIWLGDLLDVSPMQIDYYIKDNFSSYGSMFIDMTDSSSNSNNLVDLIVDAYVSSFVADAAFSSQSVSNYYDMLDELERKKNSDKANLSDEAYQNSIHRKTLSAIESHYAKEIKNLNDEIRKTTDEDEIRLYKLAIREIAKEALEFYDRCMSGEIKEPILHLNYADYGDSIRRELIRLDSYNSSEYDYAFAPSVTTPNIGDHKNGDEEKTAYNEIYVGKYRDVVGNVISSDSYKNASDEEKVNMLEGARELAQFYSKQEFAEMFNLSSDSYNPATAENKYDTLMDAGATFAEAYTLTSTKTQLDKDKSLTPEERKLELAEMINGVEGWDDEQRQAAYIFALEPDIPDIGDAEYTDEQKSAFESTYGMYVNQVYSSILSTPEFEDADADAKADMLSQATELARFYAKRDWAIENELSSDSYDPKTEKNKYASLIDAGVSFFDAYTIHQKSKEIADTDVKKSVMETNFKTWISGYGALTQRQKNMATELYGELWTMNPVDSSKYDNLVSVYGFSNSDAERIFNVVANLKPEAGKDDVSYRQKNEAILKMGMSNSDTYKALMNYNTTSASEKIKKFKDNGLPASVYVAYYNAKYTKGNKDGKWNQDELKDWLDDQNLTNSQRAIIWSLTDSKWKSNPFE